MSSVRDRSSPQPRQQRRQATDPLAHANGDRRDEAQEEGAAPARRRGNKHRVPGEVPPVRDATGEKVMEQFEDFLRK